MTAGADSARPILVTGGSGQVGFELTRALARAGTVVAPSSGELNLLDPRSVRSYVRDLKPQLIVNAAAHTAVDLCESDVERAQALNADAPGLLAAEAKRLGAGLVHYSTDYVFDGTKTGPYTEIDRPNPVSVYGKTKLAGEQAVTASGAAALIFRCEWVYSRRGKNFLLTMLRLGREKPSLNIVADQKGSPTWARAIAAATGDILSGAKGSADLSFFERHAGVYHMAASGSTTWFGFAEAIFEIADGPKPRLTAIATSDYPTPAKRPANSVFDTSKLKSTFGISLPDWRADLRDAMTAEP